MYFNHYLFLNKLNRGRNSITKLIDSSIDTFYNLLMQRKRIITQSQKLNEKSNEKLNDKTLLMIPRGGFGNVLFIYINRFFII